VIFAGTIGASKTVLALCNVDEHGVRVVRTQRYASQELASLDKALDLFLRERDIEALSGACFGVAGPVVDGVARVTNLGWVLDAASLSKKFGITVSLINDLQATALGSLVVAPDKLVVLQEPAPGAGALTAHPPIAVLAVGTGLGEATLVHDGKRYRALPSEGGHADFAPATDDEIGLLTFLRGRHGHVSYERVLSSSGILDIYEYTRSRSSEREPTWLAHDIAAGDPSMAIVNAALGAASGSQRGDACCVRTIEMFTEMLGAEAGNIALRAVAGRVVIGGGIPHKLLPALQRGGLTKRFNDKGRFSRWTQHVGVRVLVEPRAGLLGAASYAATSP
jgi:glucokinase